MDNKPVEKKWLQRYTASQRSNHWVIAISFIILLCSGLSLFHPAMSFLNVVLGGPQWNKILHPFLGVIMVLAFMLLTIRLWKHNIWKKRDTEWMKNFHNVVAGNEHLVPHAGRYNAGQKLMFYVLFYALLALIISGFIIWQPYFAPTFSIEVRRFAVLVHSVAAVVLILNIVVHVYAAIWVKGAMQAMVEGRVSWGWAWKHHRHWFNQETGNKDSEKK